MDGVTLLHQVGALEHRARQLGLLNNGTNDSHGFSGTRREQQGTGIFLQTGAPPHLELNGCLAPIQIQYSTHPIASNKNAKESNKSHAKSSSQSSSSSPSFNLYALPPSYLTPDTPSSFLRTGSINLCGRSSHDLDLIARLILEYLVINWNAAFGDTSASSSMGMGMGMAHGSSIGAGGVGAAASKHAAMIGSENMRRLHQLPFNAFRILVNLRNSGGRSTPSNGSTTNDGAEGGNNHHVWRNAEAKAAFNQAHIHAALLSSGVPPSHHHNLFARSGTNLVGAAAALGMGGIDAYTPAPGSGTGAAPASHVDLPHADLVQLVAAPSISLPPARLARDLRRLYHATRSEENCDMKIVIEEEEDGSEDEDQLQPADNATDQTSTNVGSTKHQRRKKRVKDVIWAHRIILAWGSTFFRAFLCSHAANHTTASTASTLTSDEGSPLATSSSSPSPSWDSSVTILPNGRSYSTVHFPAASWTRRGIEVVLKYIYYNSDSIHDESNVNTHDGGSIDFMTALQLIDAHVTDYLGLRQYDGKTRRDGGNSSISSSYSSSPSRHPFSIPPHFTSDLERSCSSFLHACLHSTSLEGSLRGLTGVSASECMHLIQSSYVHGSRSLFSHACALLDYTHMDQLMQQAMNKRRRKQERQRQQRRRQRRHRQNIQSPDPSQHSKDSEATREGEGEGESHTSTVTGSVVTANEHQGHREAESLIRSALGDHESLAVTVTPSHSLPSTAAVSTLFTETPAPVAVSLSSSPEALAATSYSHSATDSDSDSDSDSLTAELEFISAIIAEKARHAAATTLTDAVSENNAGRIRMRHTIG